MSVRIPDLIGVTVDDSRCILSEAQVLRLGMLLLRLRPADSDGVSFLGGALSALATTPAASAVAGPMPHALGDMLGDDAFLVLAGPHGALALLTARTPQGYATRLYSDPERVDRAALVLAQFGDVPYALDMTADPESQRALAVRVLLALMSDSELRGADLNALLPDEHNWLRMARNLSEHSDPATVLTIPPVQQVIRACGGQRALVGTLDARRVLRVLAASDTTAPLELGLNHPTLTPLLQTLRPSSIAANAWQADGQAWVQQAAVTLIPLTRKQELAGALLVTSERPLSLSARATLNALGVLLNAYLSARPVPAAVPAAPVATTLPPRSPTATPAALRAPQTSPLSPSLVSPPARPVPAASARAVAPTLSGIEALLDRIDEGVIVVEPTGALASFNAAATQLLNLADADRNRALAETAPTSWYRCSPKPCSATRCSVSRSRLSRARLCRSASAACPANAGPCCCTRSPPKMEPYWPHLLQVMMIGFRRCRAWVALAVWMRQRVITTKPYSPASLIQSVDRCTRYAN
ncbi:MAG: hypothetical protein HC911_10310 [Chloroflexaceae bacterium]|nr:hypothetical protein [Chloroflexaceae bacterium]